MAWYLVFTTNRTTTRPGRLSSMPSAAPRLAGRGAKGIGRGRLALPRDLPGSDGLHPGRGWAAAGGLIRLLTGHGRP
jgi:hypothetical protein